MDESDDNTHLVPFSSHEHELKELPVEYHDNMKAINQPLPPRRIRIPQRFFHNRILPAKAIDSTHIPHPTIGTHFKLFFNKMINPLDPCPLFKNGFFPFALSLKTFRREGWDGLVGEGIFGV